MRRCARAWVQLRGAFSLRAAVQLPARLALLCAFCALAVAGCAFDNEVGQDGQYAFLPGANVDDLAPYPLEHLLIVEDDAETHRAFVYLFAGDPGELRKAALGLPDLRRLALNYAQYTMAFDPPRSRYLDERAEARGESLVLTLDGGAKVDLVRLDNTGLGQSGASRWLSSVSSDDFDVRAYFAAIELDSELNGELDGDLPAFTVKDGKTKLAFDPQLVTPELNVTFTDDALMLDYGKLVHADSLTFDLWQRLAGKEEPHLEVEAAVRTLLPSGGMYGANASLVTDAAGKGCWSQDRPLGLRLAQLARHYTSTNGGLVTLHTKLDSVFLAPEDWTALLGKPVAASYCKNYE